MTLWFNFCYVIGTSSNQILFCEIIMYTCKFNVHKWGESLWSRHAGCSLPLGVKSGRIKDSQITASDYIGKTARLSNERQQDGLTSNSPIKMKILIVFGPLGCLMKAESPTEWCTVLWCLCPDNWEPRLARLDQSGYINAWMGRDSKSWLQVKHFLS